MSRHVALAAGLLIVLGSGCRGRDREAAPAAAPPTAAPAAPRIVDGSFASEALGATKRYRVWLPAGYDQAPTRRWPVIYLLHGLGGNQDNWLGQGRLAEAAAEVELAAIVVMPDGDAGFYVDAVGPGDPGCATRGNPFSPREAPADYCVPRRAYSTYVVRDLIGHVDATYRTIARREGRGIAGLSMGGFGALQLAMRHPQVFAAAASHSGVDALLYAGPHPYRADAVELLTKVEDWGRNLGSFGQHVRDLFGPDVANWRAHDPAHLVDQLAPGALALYLDCGTEDLFALHDQAQYLHDRLTARGLAHTWYLGPGGHDFGFWRERIDDSLRFFAGALARPE